VAGDAERRWQDRFGARAVGALRGATQPLLDGGRLQQGTEP
jgi:hypothetical protein